MEKTLQNLDRIYSSYKGEMGDTHQQSTRERFAWQASVIKGTRILDIGCSQGILDILLAREGKDVLGVDIVEESIAFANNLKSLENETTQKNVSFLNTDYLSSNITEKFDTIILGETIEHFFYPQNLITKVLTNLKPLGEIIITIPFGINDYYDHRRTYYIYDLLELVWRDFKINEIRYGEIRRSGDWVGFVATKRQKRSDFNFIPKEILQELEQTIYAKDRKYLDLIAQHKSETTLLQQTHERIITELNELKETKKTLEATLRKQANLIKSFNRRKVIRLIKKLKQLKDFSINSIRTVLQRSYSYTSRKRLEQITRLAKKLPQSNGSSFFTKFNCNIAIITDEFMFHYYENAVNLLYINSGNYKDQITKNTDLLLFISCWQGMEDEDWRGIAQEGSPAREKLYEIFEYCKSLGIKVVFQTIEDPSNYDRFLPIAKKADFIFTSDQDKIPDYKKDTNNNNVFFLEYGVNPYLHNPIGCNIREEENLKTRDKVFFAGSWAQRYPDRCKDLQIIFDGLLKNRSSLIVADRNYGNKEYEYPFKYRKFIIPPIEHKLLQRVHKLFDWSININSIKYSSTMCAMRVYELQALGSLVLSNYAISVYNKFPNLFIINQSSEISHILKSYTKKDLYRLKVRGIRNVFSNATVFDRLNYIFEILNLNNKANTHPKVIIIADHITKQIKTMFDLQSYPNKELYSLKKFQLLKKTDFQYVTFFDAKNVYGEYYIEDMMNCFKFVDVAYVTKSAFFDSEGILRGVSHNYVRQFNGKHKTIFNLKEINIRDILQETYPPNLLGYSSDPFEFNEKPDKFKQKLQKNHKELGVVIPTYNNGNFLVHKAFLSLQRSTIFDRMQIVLVDDGSTDQDTIQEIKRLEKEFPNVKTYFFPTGGSGSASRPRNKGLELLTTEYITYLDPDNEAINDAYSKLLKIISKDKDMDFIFGSICKLGNHKFTELKTLNSNSTLSRPKQWLVDSNFKTQSIQACIIKKQFLIQNKLKSVENAVGQDTLFFMQMMATAKKVQYMNIPVHIYYAERAGSIVNNISKSYFTKSLKLESVQVPFLKKSNLLEQYKRQKYFIFMKEWYGNKLKMGANTDNDANTETMKQIAGLYGFDLEKTLTDKYLNKIPKTNGTEYYKRENLNIGIITDNLAYDYFKDSANFFYLNHSNYKQVFEQQKLDFIMFVTCWRGILNNDWAGIATNPDIKDKLYEILAYSKNKNTPIVFWSKEDPIHYDKFIDIAKRSDFIFTTDENCINKYKQDTNNHNVYILRYGINPTIHNPIGTRIKNDLGLPTLNEVLFAGSWYEEFEKRCVEQRLIFDGVLASNKTLRIIDRNYFNQTTNKIYPRQYLPHTLPPVEYKKLQQIHKLFDWSINVNIVSDSPTMCAARIYELQALGVSIISNPSLAVSESFPQIYIPKNSQDVTAILSTTSPLEIYRNQAIGIRNAYNGNTVFDRITEILTHLGKHSVNKAEDREALVVANHITPQIKRMFTQQNYKDKTLILEKDIKKHKTGRYYAHFSEKYNYKANYLQDMINAFKYTDVSHIANPSGISSMKNTAISTNHNYIKGIPDMDKSVYSLRKTSIHDICKTNQTEREGYSIDPFEID